MIRKILLAADGAGSWSTAAALFDLLETAGTDVEVEVLHVNEVEYVKRAGDEVPPDEDFCEQARTLVEDIVADLCDRGVRASIRIRSGVYDDVAEDIVAEARERGAGLIVVGSHPRSGLTSWLHGSVSQNVLRRASCPVLVVRDSSVAAA